MTVFLNKCKFVFFLLLGVFLIGKVNGIDRVIEQYKSSLPIISLDKSTTREHVIAQFLIQFCPAKNNICGYECLQAKIGSLIAQEKPLLMYLPGFPFKSINRTKCISALIDVGELLALITLEHIAKQIEQVYPLVQITIVSDGYAYKTPVDPDDEVIAHYHALLQGLLTKFSHLSFQDGLSLGGYACDADVLRDAVKSEVVGSWTQENQETADDMAIFIKRDSAFLGLTSANITQVSMTMVQCSMQYGQFLKRYYSEKDFIRLSVHPHTDVSKKLGINLIFGHKGTPWHNAVVVVDGQIVLTNHINYDDLSQPVVHSACHWNGLAYLKPAKIVMTRGGYDWRPF